jgi:hypothetical protein
MVWSWNLFVILSCILPFTLHQIPVPGENTGYGNCVEKMLSLIDCLVKVIAEGCYGFIQRTL